MKKVSLLLPVYNQASRIESIVRGILAQQLPKDWELLIADDGSTDKTRKILSSFANRRDVQLLLNTENKGRSRIRNELAEKAKGKWILFVDGDCKIGPYFFKIWERQLCLESDESMNTFFGRVQYERERSSGFNRFLCENSGADKLEEGEPLPHKYLTSAHFAVRREVFLSLGGFDTSLQKWGGEDYDFSARMHRHGLSMFYLKNASIKHPDIQNLPHYFARLFEFGKTNLPRLVERYPQEDPFFVSNLQKPWKRHLFCSSFLARILAFLLFRFDSFKWPVVFYQYLIFNHYGRGFLEVQKKASEESR